MKIALFVLALVAAMHGEHVELHARRDDAPRVSNMKVMR